MTRAHGRLADNVVHFARALRTAGMPVGTDRVLTALAALKLAGLKRREDFHAVLRACLLDRIEHAELFDQAFALFWQDPDLMGRLRALRLPDPQRPPGTPSEPAGSRRLADALFPNPPQPPDGPPPPGEAPTGSDAALTVSERERLQTTDFDTMTAEEWRHARRQLESLRPLFERLPTRRLQPAARAGRFDGRATLRDAARHGGELRQPRWREPRRAPVPVVLLADISGSMSRYSRVLLHFAHVLGRAEAPVESFVFGTRLTRITRQMARRDPDIALADVLRSVPDWSGGTRIAAALSAFNHRWARRALPPRATVLLVTDGLEHGTSNELEELSAQTARLARSCRQLIWLNPLLRFEGFEPRAGGVKAMLPHVHRFLPTHDLRSLGALVDILAGPSRRDLGGTPGRARDCRRA